MRRATLAALLLAGAGGASGVVAQGFGNSTLTATISQSVEADSNFDLDDPSPGTSYFADTRLILGVLNETPTQVFALGLDTGLRALWEAEEDFDFTFASPSTASLDYGQDWAGAAIDAGFRYRQTEVNFNRPLQDFLDEDGNIDLDPDDPAQQTSDTTQQRYDADIALELANDAPSSYTFTLSNTTFDFSDVSANNTPRTTTQGSALWRLQLNPVISSAVLGSYYYYDADNAANTNIQIAEVDFGVIYEPSEIFGLTVGVGYADRTRKDTNNAGARQTTEDEQGVTLRGAISYSLEDVTVTGNARVSTAAPDTRLNGNLRVAYPLPRGRLVGRLFQRYVGGDSGDEIRVAGAGLGFTREINTVSDFGIDLAVSNRENQDVSDDEDDGTRFDATATYSRALTEVVNADIGYRFRSQDTDVSATSNAVFFQIGRTFETRP